MVLSPFELVGLRYFSGFLVLSPLLWARSRAALRALPGRVWLRLALIGLLAYPIGNSLVAAGLRSLPASTGSILVASAPLFTLLIGYLTLREIPNRKQWLGVGLSLAGALVFFWQGLQTGEVQAILIMLLATLALSYYVVLSRGLAREDTVDTYILTAIPLAIGGGALLLFFPPTYLPDLPSEMLQMLAWLGVVNTALATMLWNYALRKLQAFEINVLLNLSPMFTALLAMFAFGEHLTAWQWLGMAITIIGVMIVGAAKQEKQG